MGYRIPLSQADLGPDERALLLDAFESGSLDAGGPQVEAFEADMATYLSHRMHPLAVTSGTAALHLALLVADVAPGDEALCPTLTHIATANAITYVGAKPVFVDADPDTWTVDPELLSRELRDAARRGRLPSAVVTVDFYGQCAEYDAILEVAREFEIPVIEDAALALGATYGDKPAGTLGDLSVFSFNSDQVITASGGGMLLTREASHAARALELAQAGVPTDDAEEQPAAGFEYRLSDLLAAVGRAQLRSLESKVARRREIFERYREHLDGLPGLHFQVESPAGRSNRWLSCLTVDASAAPCDRDAVLARLGESGIEAQPVWKPMHLQPAHQHHRRVGGGTAERIFTSGLCLPSGSALKDDEVDEVARVVASAWS